MNRRSLYIVPLFLLYCAFAHYPNALATVTWSGSPSSVTDDDIVITGPTTQELNLGHTYVRAENANITIDVTQNTLLIGNTNGQSILHFDVEEGHTITIQCNHDFITQGSASNGDDHLLILYSGAGKIIWEIKGDKEVVFGKDPQTDAATRAYVVLKRVDEYSQGPEVFFRRASSSRANSDELITVRIDNLSTFGYLADANVGDNTLYGAYVFDCATSGAGLFELNIKDRGSFLVWPQRIYTDPDNVTLADIDPARLAGGQAILRTVNGLFDMATQAGLWITNENHTFHHLRFDPFLKLGVRQDVNNSNPENDYVGSFLTEKQKGLVIGSNGLLDIQDTTYVINIALDNNINPNVTHIPGWQDKNGNWIPASRIIKSRNPSAIFFDQSLNPWATEPTVRFGNQAALFAGSGVGIDGEFNTMRQPHSFVVPVEQRTNQNVVLDSPYTNFVLDCEGNVNFIGIPGSNGSSAKIELLSLEVRPSGGYAVIPGVTTQLPSRTFNKDSEGNALAYNKGSFLINGRMNLFDLTLTNTDENSNIFPRDDVSSEPVYIGGETFSVLRGPVPFDINGPANNPDLRPKITFTSSDFALNTSAAVSGVDLLVSNKVVAQGLCLQNLVNFIFGYNGVEVDQGQGQTLLLGTSRSSYAYDGISPISADAHLDVMQTNDLFDLPSDVAPYAYDLITQEYTYVPYDHALLFNVAPNDPSVIERTVDFIDDQLTTQTVYLGQNSNISIGTNADTTGFYADTHPWVRILGDYFTIESSGGATGDVRIGGKTGQGAIFIDLNGRFSTNSLIDCSIGCMVIRSRNYTENGGQVKLPFQNVHFDDSVAVADWNLNFQDLLLKGLQRLPAQDEYTIVPPVEPAIEPADDVIIVNTDEFFQVYRIDFSTVLVGSENRSLIRTHDLHLHKNPTLNMRKKNGTNRLILADDMPTIEGHVEQLQITGSLIGDIIQIRVRGPKAYIGEVNFVNTKEDGELPSAIFVLEDGGTVGIGSANLNRDSNNAPVTLGRNGILIVANAGGGQVILNSDVEIEGHAPFFFGPDAQPGTVLRITGEEGVKLYMDYTSTLDLRPLSNNNLNTNYPPVVQENRSGLIIDGGNIVEFGDGLEVNVQPGAKIVFADGAAQLPTGILRFADNAFLNFVEYSPMDDQFAAIPLGAIDNELSATTSTDAAAPHNQYAPLINYGNGLLNTSPFRARIFGNGIIEFKDGTYGYIPYGVVVGVETLNEVVDAETQTVAEIKQTDVTFRIKDGGKFYIGEQNFVEGGVLQIGNVRDNGADHSIKFNLELDGKDALFTVGALGVVGFNVGVGNSNISKISDLLVDTLYNVSDISITMNDGDLEMSRIYDTNSPFSSILLIGDNGDNTPTYSLVYEQIGSAVDTIAERRLSDALMRGGCNLAYIKKGTINETTNNVGLLAPIVLDQDNQVQVGVTGPFDAPVFHERLRAGIVASTELQDLTQNEVAVNALTYFNTLKTPNSLEETSARNRANAGTPGAETLDETILVDTVVGTRIVRDEFADIFVSLGGDNETARQHAVEYGAVFADIGSLSGQINALIEIPV